MCTELGTGVIVQRPRESDAIGKALRRAFSPDAPTPADWTRALHAIDLAD